jgi:TP901 family phage tail tape measure protein
MRDMIIKTIFSATDQVTSVFGKMASAAGMFDDRASRAFRHASKQASLFKSVFAGVTAANMARFGVSKLTQGLGAATREFISYDHAIIGAAARFRGLDLTQKEGIATFEKLKTTARIMGRDTQFTATQAAEALNLEALSGMDANQAISALPGVLRLATVASLDLTEATSIATDTLGAFGMRTQDNIKLQANMNRINDVMAKTSTSTSTPMTELFESVKKGGPVFTQAGQDIETFSAMIGMMANHTLKGEEAGTQLRNMMLRLANPTKRARELIQALGVHVQDQRGNFKDAISIIGDFQKGLLHMGTRQKSAALATIFGTRAITGMSIMLSEGADKLKAFREKLYAAGGTSKQIADLMLTSLDNKLKILWSSLVEVGFKFLSAFATDGKGSIDDLVTAVNNFDVQPIVDGTKKAINIIKGLIHIIDLLSPAIKMAIFWFIIYEGVLSAGAIISATARFSTFLRAIRELTRGETLLTSAQVLLNLAMEANPVFMIVTGIALLIGAVYLLYKHWDLVTGALKKAWGWFNKMLDNPFFTAAALIFAPFFTIPALIIKHWQPIKDFFGGLFDKIASLGHMMSGAFGMVEDAFGIGYGSQDNSWQGLTPPNQSSLELSRGSFYGEVMFKNAPDGTTVKSSSSGSAPPIKMGLLGAN